MKYSYRARTKSGILRRGTVDAENELEARQKVLARADFIIDIERKENFLTDVSNRVRKQFEDLSEEWDKRADERRKQKENRKKLKKSMSVEEFEYVKDILTERLLELGYSERSVVEGVNDLNRYDFDLEQMCFSLGLDDYEYKSLRKKVLFDGKHKGLVLSELKHLFKWQRGVTTGELIEFSEQLSILLRNGVELSEAVRSVKEYTTNKYLNQVLARVEERIREGYSLSRAMYEYQEVFSLFYISMIEVGEQTGVIEDTLLDIVKILKINNRIKKELMKVAVYPTILFVGMFGFLFIAKFFLIPEFRNLFESMGTELPLLTRILFAFSDHMTFYFIAFGVIGALIYQGVKRSAFIRGRLKLLVDQMSVSVYPFKKTFVLMNMLQLTSSLQISIKNGMTLNKSLMLAEKAVMNNLLKKELRDVLVKVEEGNKLSDALQDSTFVYPNFKASVYTGEKSGELEGVLSNLMKKYEDDLELNISMLLSSLQPISLGIAGGLLLPILLGLYGPILQMTRTIGAM